MTDKEGRQLISMISVNYTNFMPTSQEGARVKIGMWMQAFAGVPFEKGYKAVAKIIAENTYPPTIAHFKEALGYTPDLTRDEMEARLPGPVFGTEEGFAALYTADMTRVNELMAELDKELSRGGNDAGKEKRDAPERDTDGSRRRDQRDA